MKPLILFLTLFLMSFHEKLTKKYNTNRKISIITKLSLKLDWNLTSRFVIPDSFTNETEVVCGYNRRTHKYLDEYVNPSGYGITLKANTIGQAQFFGRLTYKWEITGIKKDDNTINDYYFTITTDKKGLFAGSIVSAAFHQDCNRIPLLPYRGTYKIKITVFVNNPKLNSTIEEATFEEVINIKDYLVVAMGDSFTSGEGNPDVNGISDDENWCDAIKIGEGTNSIFGTTYDMKQEAVWVEPLAHRSFLSASAKASELLENSDPHSCVTFINVGCSGAKITKGLFTAQHPEWQSNGQIDLIKGLKRNRKIDALLISIGINDLGNDQGGISKLIEKAAKPFIELYDSEEMIHGIRQVEKLELLYTTLNEEIKSKLSAKSVFIYEIPTNIFRNSNNGYTQPCGALSYISLADAIILDRIGAELNLQQKLASQKFGWFYVSGIVDAFKGHGYCEPSSVSWYRAASTSCKNQGDTDGTIHPNEKGHQKIAELVFPIIKHKLQEIVVPTIQGNILITTDKNKSN